MMDALTPDFRVHLTLCAGLGHSLGTHWLTLYCHSTYDTYLLDILLPDIKSTSRVITVFWLFMADSFLLQTQCWPYPKLIHESQRQSIRDIQEICRAAQSLGFKVSHIQQALTVRPLFIPSKDTGNATALICKPVV